LTILTKPETKKRNHITYLVEKYKGWKIYRKNYSDPTDPFPYFIRRNWDAPYRFASLEEARRWVDQLEIWKSIQ